MKSKFKWFIFFVIIIVMAYVTIVPGFNTERIDIVGSTSVQPLTEKLVNAYLENHSGIKINVQGGGSGMGIRSVHQGIADIGMSSKNLSDSEKQNITEVELGKEGIVIAVNKDNNITDLTKNQLKNIFDGNITNWKQVGGKNQQIHVITREDGSGTRTSFESMVMGNNKIKKDAIVQSSTESVKQAVVDDSGAIGYISFAHTSDDEKSLSIDGINASEETIANGSYELERPFLLIVEGKPTGEVKKFLDWVKSPPGQKIIKDEKIIPTN